MKTNLNGYTLWYDGYSQVGTVDEAVALMLDGVPLETIVLDHPEAMRMHNKAGIEVLATKSSCEIPGCDEVEFADQRELERIDVLSIIENKKTSLTSKQKERVDAEMELYLADKMGLQFLRLVVFMVSTMKSKGVVWGVGRGSSCASYVLYLLGLHCVDCVKYDIPLTEFFKPMEGEC